MKQVKVGVIGVGRMGERHCRVLSNIRKTSFIGVYDLNKDLVIRVAKLFVTLMNYSARLMQS